MKKWIILTIIVCVLGVGWWVHSIRQNSILNVIGEDTANLAAMTTVSQQNGLKVKMVKASYDDLVKRTGEDLANNTALFDVLLQYPLSISTYAQNNWIVPYDNYQPLSKNYPKLETEVQDIFTNVWEEIGYYGYGGDKVKAYGVPFAANTMLLCYNLRLFKQYQAEYRDKYNEDLAAPTTWDQFYKIAKFFGEKDDLSGVCLEGQDYWIAWEWSNIAFSYGGGVMKKHYGWQTPPSSDLLVDSPETLQATKFWLSLKPFNKDKDFFGVTVMEQIAEMQKGKTAMCLLWSDNAYNILHGTKGGIDYSDGFGFAPIPGNKSMIAGGIFMINAASKKKSAAIDFITAMLEDNTQIKLASSGLCSPRKSVYQNSEVLRLPYSKALYASLERGTYMLDAGPDSDLIFNALSTHLKEVWKGQSSVEEALHRTRIEIETGRDKIFGQIQKK